jgi:TrmH RNA methyltransferase
MARPPRPRNRTGAEVDGPPRARDLLRICGLAAVAVVFARDSGRVERLFFEPRLRARAGGFCEALARGRKPYRQIEAAELSRIAGTVLHGGIVAVARPRPLVELDPRMASLWAADGRPLVILDGVGNPHNLGAIARTAAFFGLERIVLADRPEQALPSDASYRVAEGGLEEVTAYRARLRDALLRLRPAYRILGAGLDRRARPLQGVGRPAALVFGNEERGLGGATLAACDEIVTIPGGGRVQSLNVAAAAAILIYELTRA